MSIQQVSPNSVAADPASVNPQVKSDQMTAPPLVDQNIQKSIQTAITDTVTISQHAVQKLSSESNTTDQAKHVGGLQQQQYIAVNDGTSNTPSSATTALTGATTFSMFA